MSLLVAVLTILLLGTSKVSKLDCDILYFDDSRDGAATIGIFDLEEETYQHAHLNMAGYTHNHVLSPDGMHLAMVHVDGYDNQRNIVVMNTGELEFEVVAAGAYDSDWMEFVWLDDSTILVKFTSMQLDAEHGTLYYSFSIDPVEKRKIDEKEWNRLNQDEVELLTPACT